MRRFDVPGPGVCEVLGTARGNVRMFQKFDWETAFKIKYTKLCIVPNYIIIYTKYLTLPKNQKKATPNFFLVQD
jgi:hypothetical protein